MTVTIKKVGGSVAVVIPKSVAKELELSEGSLLTLKTTGDSIVMRKQGRRPRRPLRELVAQINSASYARRNKELRDTGPVGKEVW